MAPEIQYQREVCTSWGLPQKTKPGGSVRSSANRRDTGNQSPVVGRISDCHKTHSQYAHVSSQSLKTHKNKLYIYSLITPIYTHTYFGFQPLSGSETGQRSKQGMTHLDVDIYCSERLSLQLHRTHLHSPLSTEWIWITETVELRHLMQCKINSLFPTKNEKMYVIVGVFYLCRSVCPLSVWISLRACSLPTPGIPWWRSGSIDQVSQLLITFNFFCGGALTTFGI